MFRIGSAELRYGAKGVLAWLAVLLTVSLWPLLERPGVESLGTVLAIMAIFLPFVAVIGNLHLLGLERNEKRLRLFRALPVSGARIAAGRLLRSLAVPLLTLGSALLLLLAGFVAAGAEFLSLLTGAWVLLTLYFLACAASLLSTLLYDIGGMTFAQIFMVALVTLAILLNSTSPTVGLAVQESFNRLAQTPAGVLLASLTCALLALLDVAVIARR